LPQKGIASAELVTLGRTQKGTHCREEKNKE
jgi:hypothetical protein